MVNQVDRQSNKHAKGDGSHYFRKSDQRWCATLTMSSNGKDRRRVTRTVSPWTDTIPRKLKTDRQQEAEAKALLTHLQREKMRDGDIPTATQTLGSWLDVWLKSISKKKNRPKAFAANRSLVEQYLKPAIGNVQLLKLTPAHVRRVEQYVTSKPNSKRPELGNLSGTTAYNAYRALFTALKYAQQEGRVTRNVAELVDAPRKAKPTLTILTPADGVKVVETVVQDRLGSRWAAALLTGARQGELLGLELNRVGSELDLSWQLQRHTWEHGCGDTCGRKRAAECPKKKLDAPADWEHRHLTGGLWLSRPKSSAGWRIIPLVDPLKAIIQRRIDTLAAAKEPNPHNLLWTADRKWSKDHKTLLELDGTPIDPSRDNKAWHAVLARAEVPQARLHDARHTTASLLLKAGVPIEIITKILGHSSYAMSREYMDVDREQLTSALTKMSALMSGGA